jgi:hypothetical protein
MKLVRVMELWEEFCFPKGAGTQGPSVSLAAWKPLQWFAVTRISELPPEGNLLPSYSTNRIVSMG